MKKPIIGVVTKHMNCTGEFAGKRGIFVFDENYKVFYENGAIPVGLFPPTRDIHLRNELFEPIEYKMTKDEEANIIEAINLCDGVLLQGGDTNDEYELFIAKYCFDNNIPILGICAGHQIMGHVAGGKTARGDKPELHNQAWTPNVHDITIMENTKLHDMIGKSKIRVGSFHNFMVSELPPEYIISAVCDDGHIEAMEAPNKRFNVSVQFHPEMHYHEDENMLNIFKGFIKATSA